MQEDCVFCKIINKEIPSKIIYEDDNILLINKPAGMLSQKAKKEDVSLVEYVIGYLLSNGSVTKEELLKNDPIYQEVYHSQTKAGGDFDENRGGEQA